MKLHKGLWALVLAMGACSGVDSRIGVGAMSLVIDADTFKHTTLAGTLQYGQAAEVATVAADALSGFHFVGEAGDHVIASVRSDVTPDIWITDGAFQIVGSASSATALAVDLSQGG